MEALLEKLNLQLSDKKTHNSQTSFCVINNSDGSPRWVCNSNSNVPHFLNFYLISSFRSWMFAYAIRVVFFLRLQKVVFNTVDVSSKNNDNGTGFMVNFAKTNWAIFTGTVGINNKMLLYEETEKGSYFYKVAYTSKALSLIENEESALQAMIDLEPKSFICPQAEMEKSNVLRLEDLSHQGNRSNKFTEKHRLVLTELYNKTGQFLEVNKLPVIDETREKLSELELLDDNRIPKGMVRKLRVMINTIDEKVAVGFSHGDFTPWNMYSSKDKLSIYDWELANPLMPVGFDAFHFIMQQGILVDRKPWHEIKQEILNTISPSIFSGWLKNGQGTMEDYLELYLMINTVSYLHLYSQQPEWHTQVSWLLNTWNLAITDCNKDEEVNRELIIMDVFDYLLNLKYATIKFPTTSPEMLSEYSDIDLCIRKNDLTHIMKWLKYHPVTLKVHAVKKSYMTSVNVFLKDGRLLNLDLIWSFKRKSLVFLSAEPVLERSYLNSYGVRQMNKVDQIRYISLFYELNNAEIPLKYRSDFELLSDKEGPLDTLLYVNCNPKIKGGSILAKFLKTQKENRFPKNLINTFNYLIDSIKPVLFSKGMTITFSGVDGAGKSTVIENVKHEIEKKNRKRVIVLRHRPSLLPILSAWTKGKANAEQIAANTLPRQGGNGNYLNSLFRFSYYYLDYLFGQFFIFAKYISRGWVVIYDRYYFDFINDSKRSNIKLPKSIIKAGYKLLLKPDLNFFLYADPKTILSRKQELDSATIVHLTADYIGLFESLNATSAGKYIAIENIELKNTIEFIMSKTTAKVA